MANTSVMIEYVEKMDREDMNKFMDMLKKFDVEIYCDIMDYKMEEEEIEELVELEEDFNLMDWI